MVATDVLEPLQLILGETTRHLGLGGSGTEMSELAAGLGGNRGNQGGK